MLNKLLIANRGEIVCRIARTARAMNVATVAVYSDADRGARHVRACDQAFRLGAAPAAESYLDIARIIAVARQAGADAVHPGYGFLSENAAFAQACAEAGLIFVGPPASAIRAMGSKSAAKAAMAAAGVPVAPGYHGDEQSDARLLAEGAAIGYPLIIKASAGGGGKGMQVVHDAAGLPEAVHSARRLARTAFGDERLLMERYFARARHVEVQIFADAQGQVVSLFDRDCSVQRRHQKIIEEAPAPGLRDEVRAEMSEAAKRSARTVGYVGAGTVEFLLDESQAFYFMEMNTRLQVEHPVTECITGIDLVEWQIRIARGELLPRRQDEIVAIGAALEARLYAEDPAAGYMPSVGRINHLRWPQPGGQLRLDVGVECGDEVSSYYDPMLGKVIASGASRDLAVCALARALEELEIAGVQTNRALLKSILAEPDFRRGGVATNYLSLHQGVLQFGEPAAGALERALAALWCAAATPADALWSDTRAWRLSAPSSFAWHISQEAVLVTHLGNDDYQVHAGTLALRAAVVQRDASQLEVELTGLDGAAWRSRVNLMQDGNLLHLFHEGRHATLTLHSTEDTLAGDVAAEQGSLLTPLPGIIVAVHVQVGQRVARGDALVTVEAMKMEHTLTAPQPGVVGRLPFALKDRVPAGAVLVELQPFEDGVV